MNSKNISKGINAVLSACLTVVLLNAQLGVVYGQNVRVLTLEDALGIALTQSYTIENQNNRFEQSKLTLEIVKAQQKTRTTLSWNVPNYSSSIAEVATPEGSVYTNNQSFRTDANLSVTQPVRWTNGTLSFSARYTAQNQLNKQPTRTTTTNRWTDAFSLNFSQPLFQPNTQMMDWESNQRAFEISEKDYERTENGIWLGVMRDFYNLFSAKRQLEIDQNDFENSEKNYETAMNKFNAGILARVDMMQAELDKQNSEFSMEQQRLRYNKQKDDFKRSIGLPLDQEIDVAADIDINLVFVEIDPEKAFEEAFNRSVDLLNQEYGIIDQENSIERTEAQDKINATLNLSYGLNESDDFGLNFLHARFWDNRAGQATVNNWLDNLFKDFTQTNSISIRLNIPVYDSGRRKFRIQRSQLQLDNSRRNLENQKENLKNQIQSTLDAINNARVRIDLTAGSEQLALENYSISEERFNIGDIDGDALFLQNQRLRSAQENALGAKIDYLIQLATLYNQTFWDFEHNRPLNETVKLYIR